MGQFAIRCAGCGKQMTVDPSKGTIFQCPHCQHPAVLQAAPKQYAVGPSVGTQIAAALAMLIALVAAFCMLSIRSEAGNTIFESMAHGIGVYFIAKAIYMVTDLCK